MAELTNNQRVKFPRGEQRRFIELALHQLKTNIAGLSQIVGVHPRSCRDWQREKFTISLSTLKLLCAQANIEKPVHIKIVGPFWYASKGARVGGKALIEKYGCVPVNESYRKKKWLEWWERDGKFKEHSITKEFSFKKPAFSKEFAEFIGIMMGNGGMSAAQICITLHHLDDLAYSKFVIKLMTKLFDIIPGVYHSPKDSVNDIVISRSGLVKYLNSIGLPIGNKVAQQFDIPSWIKQNPQYKIACLRGLVDTDGSVFTHKYKSNGRWYAYKKLAFCSASSPLRTSVHDILTELALRPRMAQEREVRLDSKESLQRYFKLVGSHNPKHLRRYHS